MAKHAKLILGSLINIITGIAGFLIWNFAAQDSVKMARDLKETAGTVFLLAFIPALIFFVIWYFGCVKANSQVGVKRPNKWIYFLAGVATSLAIPAVCSLAFFDKAILWAIVTAAIAIVGSLVSYLTCEPR